MFDKLEQLDVDLFFAINSRHNSFFDSIFYWISNAWVWIPVYIVLAYVLIKLYGIKTALIQIALVGVMVIAADLISVYAFKNVIGRYRPSQNLVYGDLVHIVNGHKGGIFGFVSSHAVNFAVWTIMVYWFFNKKLLSKWLLLIFIIPVLVGYSRVYLGVHYPGDVVGGIFIGSIMAILGIIFYKKLLNKFPIYFSKQ